MILFVTVENRPTQIYPPSASSACPLMAWDLGRVYTAMAGERLHLVLATLHGVGAEGQSETEIEG